jgi:protein tyrosine/serine phosphatase
MRDHAVLRAVLPNVYRVDQDVWRGAHPGRGQLARLKARGVATIVNLRGDADSVPNAVERAACAELGIPLHFLAMSAGKPPRPEALQELLMILRDAPKPLFLHCKSGSDRTALAVTLYRHVLRGVPMPEARRAFSLRYGHNRWGKARVLHRFLDTYEAARDESGIGFEDWLAAAYDQASPDMKRHGPA